MPPTWLQTSQETSKSTAPGGARSGSAARARPSARVAGFVPVMGGGVALLGMWANCNAGGRLVRKRRGGLPVVASMKKAPLVAGPCENAWSERSGAAAAESDEAPHAEKGDGPGGRDHRDADVVEVR